MIDILGKTNFRSTSGETSDKKSTQKNFYCTKRFVIEFEGESLKLFLSYLVYFRRYRHFRRSSQKKKYQIHATVKDDLFWVQISFRLLTVSGLPVFNSLYMMNCLSNTIKRLKSSLPKTSFFISLFKFIQKCIWWRNKWPHLQLIRHKWTIYARRMPVFSLLSLQ